MEKISFIPFSYEGQFNENGNYHGHGRLMFRNPSDVVINYEGEFDNGVCESGNLDVDGKMSNNVKFYADDACLYFKFQGNDPVLIIRKIDYCSSERDPGLKYALNVSKQISHTWNEVQHGGVDSKYFLLSEKECPASVQETARSLNTVSSDRDEICQQCNPKILRNARFTDELKIFIQDVEKEFTNIPSSEKPSFESFYRDKYEKFLKRFKSNTPIANQPSFENLEQRTNEEDKIYSFTGVWNNQGNYHGPGKLFFKERVTFTVITFEGEFNGGVCNSGTLNIGSDCYKEAKFSEDDSHFYFEKLSEDHMITKKIKKSDYFPPNRTEAWLNELMLSSHLTSDDSGIFSYRGAFNENKQYHEHGRLLFRDPINSVVITYEGWFNNGVCESGTLRIGETCFHCIQFHSDDTYFHFQKGPKNPFLMLRKTDYLIP